jgi:hypothetical protein
MDGGKLKIKFLSNQTNFKFCIDFDHIDYLTTKTVSKSLNILDNFTAKQGMVKFVSIKKKRSGLQFSSVQIFKILKLDDGNR